MAISATGSFKSQSLKTIIKIKIIALMITGVRTFHLCCCYMDLIW